MVKKFLKKKSKRMPARRRYKIEKKVREHNRKLKREAKKNPKKKKMKKDSGVPNSLPFKEKILQEAAERKRQDEEMKAQAKEEMKKLRAEKKSLRAVKMSAEKRSMEFEMKAPKKQKTDPSSSEASTKAYYKEFKKVVEVADVILEVLDARDPLGSRCPQVEQAVINSGANKRLVLVLNKIDLIPKVNLLAWLKYLRNEFPTVAFKASTQTQRRHLSQNKASIDKWGNAVQSSQCLGANVLMKLLGNYGRTQDLKTIIRVGVVGFPNVGKSSIINSLKRNRVCNIGATPGITKCMQEIHLDKHVILLDSPGIVLAKSSDASCALRNAIKVETLIDPIAPVEAILQRANHNDLLLLYNIPKFSSTHEFLTHLSKRFGRVKRGGIPDVEKAARILIQNWNSGKIKFYTHPPENHELPYYINAEIVEQMSKPFILEGILEEENADLQGLSDRVHNTILVETGGPTDGRDKNDDVVSEEEDTECATLNDEEMEDSDKEEINTLSENVQITCEVPSTAVGVSQDDKIPKRLRKKVKQLEEAQKLPGNQKMATASKVLFKKVKKAQKKSDKLASNLAASLTSALNFNTDLKDDDDAYDFKTDYK